MTSCSAEIQEAIHEPMKPHEPRKRLAMISVLDYRTAAMPRRITWPELEKQRQMLSGGPPAQSALPLIAIALNSSLRLRRHPGFAGLRTIPGTHTSDTGAL